MFLTMEALMVQSISRENPKVVAWKQDTTPYFDGLRARVFNEFKSEASPGDWWCFKLDSDEFYLNDPRDFLKDVPAHQHFVCSDAIEFRLTKEDVDEFEFTGDFSVDKEKIQYYLPTTWAEARFFKHRNRLSWNEEHHMPKNMGIVYPGKIQLLHYQYRSPEQVKKRLEIRKEAKTRGWWLHEQAEDWKELLQERSELLKAEDYNNLKLMGCRNNHLHKNYVLVLKRILHGLRILP
jgi:hypothetical protein